MFFNGSTTYYDSSGQRAGRAKYLILANDWSTYICEDAECSMSYQTHSHTRIGKLYACVRKVAMRQCGQFMMGSARVGDSTIILSGPYGSDGLPEDYDKLSASSRARFTLVPDAIADLYWHPEHSGHNSAGSEARAMVEYARVLDNPDRWPQDNPLINDGYSSAGWRGVFYKSLPAPADELWRWGPGSVSEPSDATRNYLELVERFDGRRVWYSASGRLAQTNAERVVRASYSFGGRS